MSNDVVLLVLLLVVVLLIGGVGLEVDTCNQILVIPLGVLVNGAMIVCLLLSLKVLFFAVYRGAVVCSLVLVRRNGRHVDNGESEVEVFSDGVFEIASLVPGGTLKEESMDEDTFGRWRNCFVNTAIISLDGVLLSFSLGLDLIEGPLLVRVLSGDFLHGSSQEALRVVEAG